MLVVFLTCPNLSISFGKPAHYEQDICVWCMAHMISDPLLLQVIRNSIEISRIIEMLECTC
jgi:hypothetical protein